MVYNKWLLLAALILATLLQLGQGELLEGESSTQDTIDNRKIEHLHNVNSNESSKTLSKSKFKKYSATDKPVEVGTADTVTERKTDKPKRPTKSPVSADDMLDNLLVRMVGVLESVSQDLHSVVKTLSQEMPKEEPEKKDETAISPLKNPQASSDNKVPDNVLRGLDRFLGQMVRITQSLNFDGVEDAKNGIRRNSPDNENPDLEMKDMMTAQMDMFNLLASFVLQDLSAISAQFPPLPPSFLGSERTSNTPKTAGHQDRKKQIYTKEMYQ